MKNFKKKTVTYTLFGRARLGGVGANLNIYNVDKRTIIYRVWYNFEFQLVQSRIVSISFFFFYTLLTIKNRLHTDGDKRKYFYLVFVLFMRNRCTRILSIGFFNGKWLWIETKILMFYSQDINYFVYWCSSRLYLFARSENVILV